MDMGKKDQEGLEQIDFQVIASSKQFQETTEKERAECVSGQSNVEEKSLMFCENKDLKAEDSVPDGGYGWFVVFGCFLSHVLIGGFERSDGVYYLKYKAYYNKSSQLTAWPNALVSAIRLFLGPLASALSNIYSVRLAVIVGALLMTLGQLLTAYSPDFFFLFFSQSVLEGLGSGLVYAPSIVIVGLYFDKHRGLAAGLGSAGVGVGTFCIVPLTQWLFDNYRFQDAFLILAGIAFNGLVVAMLFRPLSLHNKWTIKKRVRKVEEFYAEKLDLESDSKFAEKFEIEPLKKSSLNKTENCSKQKKHCLSSTIILCCPVEKAKSSTGKRKQIFNCSLLRNPSFVLFCISLLLFTAAFKAAFTFIPALVKSRDISESDAALVLSIAGVFDTAGRIVAGLVFDLPRIKFLRPVLFNSFIFAIAGISFLLPSMTSFASFCVVCSVYGVLTGAYISQKSVVIVDILGIENLSTSFGLLICFQAVGMCAGPPLSGAFRDTFGSFDEAFYLGGGFMTAAGMLMVLSNILLRTKTTKLFKSSTTVVVSET
ncbi:monocarboxylate transporter 12 isoform X1 [Biomphalaria glabrata]|nr:monocarboxylate transporter 12 isoform X1 [Biomphalaria glabrata]